MLHEAEQRDEIGKGQTRGFIIHIMNVRSLHFLPMNSLFVKSVKQAKRIIIAVVGFTVLLIGAAMIVLPGPAIIVIPAGLVILATEFVWARRLLKKAKTWFTNSKSTRSS